MFTPDGALMNTKQPALQGRRNSVHSWNGYMCRITAFLQYRFAVRVAVLIQAAVAAPSVSRLFGDCLSRVRSVDRWHRQHASWLLTPNRLKRGKQGLTSALEDGSRRNRDLTTTLPTMQMAPRGNSGKRLAVAVKTLIYLWPTDTKNLTSAGCLIRKPEIKLMQIPGIVDTCHGNGKGSHTSRCYRQQSLA